MYLFQKKTFLIQSGFGISWLERDERDEVDPIAEISLYLVEM